MAGTAQQQRS
uniref:Uncharacterized protein n=1 Tax=Arundo donax TaxID=35708 RepID=A0A0A9AQ69_ARUDO